MAVGDGGGIVQHQGRWYHIGGTSPAGSAAVRVSDDGVSWSRVGNLPDGRQFLMLHSDGEALWVLGGGTGFFGETFDTIWRSEDGIGWSDSGQLPNRIAGAGWVPTPTGGLIIGGIELETLTPTDVVWRATLDGNTWGFEAMEPLPEPRGFPAAVEYEGRVVVVGGFDNGSQEEVFELDLEVGTWSEAEPLEVQLDRGVI